MTLNACLGVMLIALVSLVHSSEVQARYKDEYKMSVIVGPKYPWSAGAFRFAKLVKERTDGRINIKVYTSSSLMAGKQTNEFLLHRQGIADFSFASPISWSVALKPLNLFNLPFFFDDYAHIDAVKNGQAGAQIKDLLKRVGITFLAWGESGFRALTNSQREVDSPDDMQGMNIRVIGSPIFLDTMNALGAMPYDMNWSDAELAFKRHMIQAQENPINNIAIPLNIWRYHQYVTVWHYVIDPLMFTVNNQVWASFSEEDQRIVKACAEQAGNAQIAIVRKGLTSDDQGSFDLLREKGMKVTVLDTEQRQAFRDKVQSVYDKWGPIIGLDLIEKAQADMATVDLR